MLRECKNRIPEFKGTYSLAAVSARTSIMTSTIKRLESGEMMIPDALSEILIKDLDITKEEFLTMTKIVEADVVAAPSAPASAVTTEATTPLGTMKVPGAASTAAPAEKRKRRTKAEMEVLRAAQSGSPATQSGTPATVLPKAQNPIAVAHEILATVPTPAVKKGAKELTFINHTMESYFIRVEGDSIHILENIPENMGKGTFVPHADDIAGKKISARSTPVTCSPAKAGS